MEDLAALRQTALSEAEVEVFEPHGTFDGMPETGEARGTVYRELTGFWVEKASSSGAESGAAGRRASWSAGGGSGTTSSSGSSTRKETRLASVEDLKGENPGSKAGDGEGAMWVYGYLLPQDGGEHAEKKRKHKANAVPDTMVKIFLGVRQQKMITDIGRSEQDFHAGTWITTSGTLTLPSTAAAAAGSDTIPRRRRGAPQQLGETRQRWYHLLEPHPAFAHTWKKYEHAVDTLHTLYWKSAAGTQPLQAVRENTSKKFLNRVALHGAFVLKSLRVLFPPSTPIVRELRQYIADHPSDSVPEADEDDGVENAGNDNGDGGDATTANGDRNDTGAGAQSSADSRRRSRASHPYSSGTTSKKSRSAIAAPSSSSLSSSSPSTADVKAKEEVKTKSGDKPSPAKAKPKVARESRNTRGRGAQKRRDRETHTDSTEEEKQKDEDEEFASGDDGHERKSRTKRQSKQRVSGSRGKKRASRSRKRRASGDAADEDEVGDAVDAADRGTGADLDDSDGAQDDDDESYTRTSAHTSARTSTRVSAKRKAATSGRTHSQAGGAAVGNSTKRQRVSANKDDRKLQIEEENNTTPQQIPIRRTSSADSGSSAVAAIAVAASAASGRPMPTTFTNDSRSSSSSAASSRDGIVTTNRPGSAPRGPIIVDLPVRNRPEGGDTIEMYLEEARYNISLLEALAPYTTHFQDAAMGLLQTFSP